MYLSNEMLDHFSEEQLSALALAMLAGKFGLVLPVTAGNLSDLRHNRVVLLEARENAAILVPQTVLEGGATTPDSVIEVVGELMGKGKRAAVIIMSGPQLDTLESDKRIGITLEGGGVILMAITGDS